MLCCDKSIQVERRVVVVNVKLYRLVVVGIFTDEFLRAADVTAGNQPTAIEKRMPIRAVAFSKDEFPVHVGIITYSCSSPPLHGDNL